jgi:hypothetical protein
VQRGTSTTAGIAGGAIGALLYSAFGSFQCKQCGPIPRSEFPSEVRRQMTMGSVGIVVGALALLIALLAILALLPK